MKKLKPLQIAGIIGLIVLSGARFYASYSQKKAREEQQQMLYDLSQQQLEQSARMNDSLLKQSMNAVLEQERQELDAIQANLDSIGKELEENRKRFEAQMEQ